MAKRRNNRETRLFFRNTLVVFLVLALTSFMAYQLAPVSWTFARHMFKEGSQNFAFGTATFILALIAEALVNIRNRVVVRKN